MEPPVKPPGVEVIFEKTPTGYLVNGVYPLGDYLETPEAKAQLPALARAIADEIDRRIAEKVYAEAVRALDADPRKA